MNRHLRALVIVLGIAVLVFVAVFAVLNARQQGADTDAEAVTHFQLNQVLPDFKGTTLDGKVLQLSSFRGKIVIVNFWASWCGPCVEEVPSLIKLVKAFPQQVELIAISGDSSKEDIESFLKSFPELKSTPNIHLVWDETKALAQKYQIDRLPESIVLDGQQKAVKKLSGSINWAAEDAFEYIRNLSQAGSK